MSKWHQFHYYAPTSTNWLYVKFVSEYICFKFMNKEKNIKKKDNRFAIRIYDESILEYLDNKRAATGESYNNLINSILRSYINSNAKNNLDDLIKDTYDNKLMLAEILSYTKYLKYRHEYIETIEAYELNQEVVNELKEKLEPYSFEIILNEERNCIYIQKSNEFKQYLIPIPSIVLLDNNKEIQVKNYEWS